MNLSKLGASSWILILNLILITILVIVLTTDVGERFVNYPQQVNPTATPQSNPDAAAANNNYASILMYVQKNPANSTKFITDIKNKFFSDSCTIKNSIDFNNIAQFPDGMPFS
jgi:hypothetical protein